MGVYFERYVRKVRNVFLFFKLFSIYSKRLFKGFFFIKFLIFL